VVIGKRRIFDRSQDDDRGIQAWQIGKSTQFLIRQRQCEIERQNQRIGRPGSQPRHVFEVEPADVGTGLKTRFKQSDSPRHWQRKTETLQFFF
jgi:hypothetical protein